MKRALGIAALVACGGLLTARCTTEGAAGDYYAPYYYDDPWYGYGYGFGAGIIVGGGCCGGDMGPPPHPEHPIVNPPGGDRPHPEHPIANPPGGATPKAETRGSGDSSSSRPMPSPRAAAPSRGGFGGGGRGGGGGG